MIQHQTYPNLYYSNVFWSVITFLSTICETVIEAKLESGIELKNTQTPIIIFIRTFFKNYSSLMVTGFIWHCILNPTIYQIIGVWTPYALVPLIYCFIRLLLIKFYKTITSSEVEITLIRSARNTIINFLIGMLLGMITTYFIKT